MRLFPAHLFSLIRTRPDQQKQLLGYSEDGGKRRSGITYARQVTMIRALDIGLLLILQLLCHSRSPSFPPSSFTQPLPYPALSFPPVSDTSEVSVVRGALAGLPDGKGSGG